MNLFKKKSTKDVNTGANGGHIPPPPKSSPPGQEDNYLMTDEAKEMQKNTKHIAVSSLSSLPSNGKELGLVSFYTHKNKIHISSQMNTMDNAEIEVTLNLKNECFKQYKEKNKSYSLYGLKVLSMPYSMGFKEKGTPGPHGIFVTGFATVVATIGNNYNNNSNNSNIEMKQDSSSSNEMIMSTLGVPPNNEFKIYDSLGRIQSKMHKNKCNNLDTLFKELYKEMIIDLKSKCGNLGGNAMYNVNLIFAPYGVGPAGNMEGFVASGDAQVVRIIDAKRDTKRKVQTSLEAKRLKVKEKQQTQLQQQLQQPQAQQNTLGNQGPRAGRSLSAWMREIQQQQGKGANTRSPPSAPPRPAMKKPVKKYNTMK